MRRNHLWLALAALVAVAALILVLVQLRSQPQASRVEVRPPPAVAATPVSSAPSLPAAGLDEIEELLIAGDGAHPILQDPKAPHARRVLAEDGHWYGYNSEEAFVRQRHDWPPDTAERLGPAIGLYLADFELVIDTIADGARVDAARGTPLAEEEREGARQTLQLFIDDINPIVDEVLAGVRTAEEAFPAIQDRRRLLNRELTERLGLTPAQFVALFPHIPAGEI
jgi:hypothetical protein